MHTCHQSHRPHLRAIGAVAATLMVVGTMSAGAASPAPSIAPSPSSSQAASASPGAAPAVTPSAAPTVVAVPSNGTIEATGGTWQVELPTLTGPIDPAVLVAVNDALAAGSAADLAAFQANSTLPPAGFDGTDGFNSAFSVALLNPDVLSLRVLTSMYAAGAAHPTATMQGWTFDLRTGARVTLADLFQVDSEYLALLSRVARYQLRAQLGTDGVTMSDIRRGTRPRADAFAGWAATQDGLEITFAQYQVGPYAIGMPVVVIPWARLSDLLDPAGPAAAFVSPVPSASAAPSPAASPAA